MRGEAVRPALPGGKITRPRRRALDAPHRPRPAERTRAIPGSPGPALLHPAEAARRAPATTGTAGTGGARALFEAPAALVLHAHRPRAWARRCGGGAGDLGPAAGRCAVGSAPRHVRTPDRDPALLPT